MKDIWKNKCITFFWTRCMWKYIMLKSIMPIIFWVVVSLCSTFQSIAYMHQTHLLCLLQRSQRQANDLRRWLSLFWLCSWFNFDCFLCDILTCIPVLCKMFTSCSFSFSENWHHSSVMLDDLLSLPVVDRTLWDENAYFRLLECITFLLLTRWCY